MRTRLLYLITILLTAMLGTASAQRLQTIREALERASVSQVQEKVYIHTDNQSYFVGDTLWYKAYVVRADSNRFTNMSRLLYVELLSPDGMLVERQTVVVSPDGKFSSGQFVLEDSLYSGYYELRAYTRWMLNFNVREHYYRKDETWSFYNSQMAADYYRVWDGLYSRVLPIYSKPDSPGDYDARRMYQRPKTRLPRQKKEELLVTFYPEGGHLIAGIENHVAFEVTDQHGEAVDISGTVSDNGQRSVAVKTRYMGRGSFAVTPSQNRLKATFKWHGKEWAFSLPKAEDKGTAIHVDGHRLTIASAGLPSTSEYGISILSRGILKHFQSLPALSSTPVTVTLPLDSLPTGVADVTVFDDNGQILADRLIFVNHHEHDAALITTTVSARHTYAPYEAVEMPVVLQGVTEPTTFSISVRDSYTDEPTYDDGNLMTTLLLTSELKGFIARPAHYFEADDEEHRIHLDLLMMVQGWRRYPWSDLSQGERPLRYEPEKSLTVEGAVYKMLSVNPVQPDEITNWQYGKGLSGDTQEDDLFADATTADGGEEGGEIEAPTTVSTYSLGKITDANTNIGVNHGNLRRDVLVEAELSVGGRVVGSVQRTENGRFLFNLPAFYGSGYLNMKAYEEKDSVRKSMLSRKDATIVNEDAFPDFYVKRDLFYPIFTHDYTFYEKHQPESTYEELIDTLSELSMENDVHQIANVNVKGHRRGRRAVDWNKPAYVVDAYDLYNDLTDRGLSFGKLDMRQFPVQVCRLLFGNMNRTVSYNVDGRLMGHTYYRNYSPYVSGDEAEVAGLYVPNRTSQHMYDQLKLKRLQNIRVFTDYEPRTEDSLMVQESHIPDAIVELELIANDGIQPTFRDRHIYLKGIEVPMEFYQPDYSNRQPTMPADYRRTLYWNPNAVTDDQGHFTATFYNNGKETRVRMSAAAIAPDGRLMHTEK